jgi:hypothetical protein
MDKSRLLREFAALAAEGSLDLDATRLYLLLLAGSGRSGQGKVSIGEIKTALGKSFSFTALRSACRILMRMKLIELPTAEPQPDADLVFRLLPLDRRDSGSRERHR